MKKILSNNSLKNATLRERRDLSPLIKTFVHRVHNWSDEQNKKWWDLLSKEEKNTIIRWIDNPESHYKFME